MSTPDDDTDRTNLHRPALADLANRAVEGLDSRSLGQLAALNPLIAAANPLLMTVTSLRPGHAPGNAEALRTRLVEMVKEFDAACTQAAIPEEHQHLARYALCTLIDETIQRTAWSHTAGWAQRSLSIHFFKDNRGGEKFFVILDKLVQSPSKYAWVLQLFYVCLSLGFMGRYLMREATGRQELTDLRDRLYQQVVRPTLPEADRGLSPHWMGLEMGARKFQGFTSVGLTIGLTLLLCLGMYAGYLLHLASWRSDVGIAALALPKQREPIPIEQAPQPAPRALHLHQLLAQQIGAGKLSVRESAVESVLTLSSEFTFGTGSASLAPGAPELIGEIASALDKLKGQVLVTGHTDDLPPRCCSLQFPSNYELSRARARSVADLLRSRMADAGRVIDEGRADSEPVDREKTPQARAANRRVEITLRLTAAAN